MIIFQCASIECMVVGSMLIQETGAATKKIMRGLTVPRHAAFVHIKVSKKLSSNVLLEASLFCLKMSQKRSSQVDYHILTI